MKGCKHEMTDVCSYGCHDDVDYDGEDWPEEEIADGMMVVTVRRCPVCDDFFEESGEFGLVPHVLEEHGWSEQAEQIRDLMKGDTA